MGGYTGPNNRRYEQPRRWWHLAILTTALGGVGLVAYTTLGLSCMRAFFV